MKTIDDLDKKLQEFNKNIKIIIDYHEITDLRKDMIFHNYENNCDYLCDFVNSLIKNFDYLKMFNKNNMPTNLADEDCYFHDIDEDYILLVKTARFLDIEFNYEEYDPDGLKREINNKINELVK